MNVYQIGTVAFTLIAISVSTLAIIGIIRSNEMVYKPVWIIGSLFGFIGIGVNWTHPDDFLVIFGVMIPLVTIYKTLPAGADIIKTGFPIVAAIALWKMRSTGYIDRR